MLARQKAHSGKKIFCNLWGFCLLIVLGLSLSVSRQMWAHGFNADRVKIIYVESLRVYRVIVRYTHLEIREYREVHIDFKNREEALKVYRDLVKGADFFLGDVKQSLHFHEDNAK